MIIRKTEEKGGRVTKEEDATRTKKDMGDAVTEAVEENVFTVRRWFGVGDGRRGW